MDSFCGINMSSKVKLFFQKQNKELDDIPRKLEYKNFKHKNDTMITC